MGIHQTKKVFFTVKQTIHRVDNLQDARKYLKGYTPEKG